METNEQAVAQYIDANAIKIKDEADNDVLHIAFEDWGDVGFTGPDETTRRERLIHYCLNEPEILNKIVAPQSV